MNYTNRCLVYAFLIFLPSSILAQIEGPLVSYFSRDSYKAGTQNWSIAMNDQGLVYFGNNKGLLEFDGDQWRLYPLPNKTIVRSIHIDSLGNIYVGGQNEIGVFRNDLAFNMHYESLTHFIPKAYKDFEDVWKTFSTDNSMIYCSEKAVFVVKDQDVNTLLPVSGRFENYFEFEGRLLLQDSESGLYEVIDGNLKRLFSADSFNKDRIIGVVRLGNYTSIITEESGIYHIEGEKLVFQDNETSNFIKEHKAYTCLELATGQLLIGTVQNGLIVTDQKGKVLKSLNKRTGLNNNTILCAYEDNTGNLWLGLDNGINHAELSSPFNFVNSLNGLEGTGYTAFKRGNAIFLGTNQGLFSRSFGTQNYKLFSNKASQIWGHSILDSVYYIHAHEGTFILSESDLEPISEVQGTWKMIGLQKRPGLYLQGTYEGFFVYKKSQSGNPELIGKLDGFSESSRIFEEDDQGNIWVSHAYRGLYRIKLDESGESIEEVARFNSEDGLPDDLYLTVSKIRGEIVFTTSEGIYEFDSESQVFRPHSGLSELIGSGVNVQRIIEDEIGNVWFCTDTEFGRISILPNGLYNEVETNYLNEIQEKLVDGFEDVYMLDETMAFIPVESGFIKFNTRKKINKGFNHDLMIRGMFLAENPDSLVTSGNTTISNLSLGHDQNSLVIKYVAPNYQNLNKVLYQYRLIGVSEEWSDWLTGTSKEFNNLDPGKYTFEVRAQNSFKSQSEVASTSFTIMPPWYATNAAKLIYFLILGLTLFISYRIVKTREVKKRLVLQEKSQKSLERKDEELKRVSEQSESEIVKLRNEKLRADIRHKNSELASTTMHLVQKSEILQKIRTDLSDLSRNLNDDQLTAKIRQIERAIDADVRLDKNWERFESHFDQVHQNFFKNLREKYPNLTPKDQKLCAYLRMNLSTKEVAPLLNISVRGVEISRYRLRKKLNLEPEENLVSVIMEI